MSVLTLQVQQAFTCTHPGLAQARHAISLHHQHLKEFLSNPLQRLNLLRLSTNPCKLVTDVTDMTDLVMAAVNAVLLTTLTLAVALALTILALALAIPLPVAVPVPVALLFRPANPWAGILTFSRAYWFQKIQAATAFY